MYKNNDFEKNEVNKNNDFAKTVKGGQTYV